MALFCKHKWSVTEKVVLPSAFEQMGERKVSLGGPGSMPAWVFEKKAVIVLTCDKCGKINKTVESSP